MVNKSSIFLTTDLLDDDKEYILLSVKSNLTNQFLPIKFIKITATKIIAEKIKVDFLLFKIIISISYYLILELLEIGRLQ